MNYFSRVEPKRLLCICIGMTVICTAIAFLFSNATALYVFGVCVLFSGVLLVIGYKRYRKINEITEKLADIASGKRNISLADYCEGELSRLQNDLSKITIKLYEQSESLQKEKVMLSDSIADISHQLRTPLTSMNIITSMLADENISDQKRFELVGQLNTLLNRTEWLINTLLKISKLDAGMVRFNNEQVSVRKLIDESTNLIAIPMDIKNQKLCISCGEEVITADSHWCVEAFSNILKNCMEHTPEGGKIDVEVSDNALFTQIVISDNGPGIDEADMPHIFERFYKGKNSDSTSFGIGLALAQMIVRSENGIILVKNKQTGGAEFILRFYKCTV